MYVFQAVSLTYYLSGLFSCLSLTYATFACNCNNGKREGAWSDLKVLLRPVSKADPIRLAHLQPLFSLKSRDVSLSLSLSYPLLSLFLYLVYGKRLRFKVVCAKAILILSNHEMKSKPKTWPQACVQNKVCRIHIRPRKWSSAPVDWLSQMLCMLFCFLWRNVCIFGSKPPPPKYQWKAVLQQRNDDAGILFLWGGRVYLREH